MRKFVVLSALLLAGMLGVAFGGGAESYETLSSSLGDYRGSQASPLDGADSLDWSSPLQISGTNRTLIPTKGNPTLFVRVDLSGEGNTCCIHAGLYNRTGPNTYQSLGVAGISTATAGADTRTTGRYYAKSILMFDTSSATHVELRKEDPSNGGTVTILPWVGGSAPRGAGDD